MSTVRANSITNSAGSGAPDFPNGLTDNGVAVATTADLASIGITLGTAVSSTSGTAIDFTSIPSTARRVTVMLNGVSTNGTSALLLQLGTSSGIVSTGYSGATQAGSNTLASTAGAAINAVSAVGSITSGSIVISKIDGNTWILSGAAGDGNLARCYAIGFVVALSSTLNSARITTVNGTDTFDAGTINISWE